MVFGLAEEAGEPKENIWHWVHPGNQTQDRFGVGYSANHSPEAASIWAYAYV